MPRRPSGRGVDISRSIADVTIPWSQPPIAIVSPLYPPATGGVERYVGRLAAGLNERGVPVEIVTTDPAARTATIERRDGIPVRRFPTVRGDRLFFPSPALTRWLSHNAHRYALLHLHSLHTLLPLAGTWSARADGIPTVLTAHWHGTGHTPLRRVLHLPYRPAAGWVVGRSAAIIANSQSEAAFLRRDFGERLSITVIPEGIQLPGESTTTVPATADPDGVSGRTTVLSVGRLEAYKGVERIVDAMRHLPASVRLVVVGSGPAEADIRHAANSLGDRILLRGRVPDEELRAWYQRAAAFVSLSAHESFGLTVLEAAAAGVPVVASDIPAHRESCAFVPQGRITLVSLDGDDAALARAITASLGQGRADDRSSWALPSWDGLVDATLRVYRGVLDGR
jgi:glycosyltransferase involved in cell wall biosynthesis